ncbi:MAG: hypothetical protein HC801_11830 [Nitrospira sp.]|nr:hypothetical protein [Nitrospira sp.]
MTVDNIEPHIARGSAGPPVDDAVDLTSRVHAIEVREIRKALREAHGNKSRAASFLGISRFALNRKMEKYGLDPKGEPA